MTSSLRAVRLQRSGRIVQEHARHAELGQLRRLLDERLGLAGRAGAVDEPGGELGARGGDRLGGLAEVRHVVQRIVEPEDVDAVLRRRGDEAPDEVGVDGMRADEERGRAAPSRAASRRARCSARIRSHGLSRPAPYGAVEDAAARDLEVLEAGPVEDLGDAQEVRRRDPLGERVLPEQADGRVDERGHGRTLTSWSGEAYAREM